MPHRLAFSEFKGYGTGEDLSVIEAEHSVKEILANPNMIKAYKGRLPDNGKAFPEEAKIVKIDGIKKNPVSPYFVEAPDTLKSLAFIEKDSKRFPNTRVCAYAKFEYDPESQEVEALRHQLRMWLFPSFVG